MNRNLILALALTASTLSIAGCSERGEPAAPASVAAPSPSVVPWGSAETGLVTPACRLVTKADVERAGAVWGEPQGNITDQVEADGFRVRDDRCVIGSQVQIEILEAPTEKDARTLFDSIVRSANQGVAPLATPDPVPDLGEQASQLPGWVFIRKGKTVLAVNVTYVPPAGFAPPTNVLNLARAANVNLS
ncbi:hypothetical protein ABT008_16230 [Micromonospora sp. NPDC002389]|uniref:hypothetical protein n=1 Tax=Micromonospora sp. NPDC002389 TaxID=3154272 RepID=UPI00332685F7